MACVKSIAAVCRYLAPAAFYWEADITASNNIKDESLCWTAYNLYLILPKQRRGSLWLAIMPDQTTSLLRTTAPWRCELTAWESFFLQSHTASPALAHACETSSILVALRR